MIIRKCHSIIPRYLNRGQLIEYLVHIFLWPLHRKLAWQPCCLRCLMLEQGSHWHDAKLAKLRRHLLQLYHLKDLFELHCRHPCTLLSPRRPQVTLLASMGDLLGPFLTGTFQILDKTLAGRPVVKKKCSQFSNIPLLGKKCVRRVLNGWEQKPEIRLTYNHHNQSKVIVFVSVIMCCHIHRIYSESA